MKPEELLGEISKALGVEHLSNNMPSVGIGITTRNRKEVFEKTLEEIRKHTPHSFKIVVVDDSSDKPIEGSSYRFEKQAGIARAKNKCIELLEGIEHVFLFDDDIYPIKDEWWKPYVASSEPHLMYQFDHWGNGASIDDVIRVYEDSSIVAYSGARGCMLYVHRSVIDRVGGMDSIFGVWGWEHVEYSRRIHHAGLTSHAFADIQGSSELFYSMDEHQVVKRSVTDAERKRISERNSEIYLEKRKNLHDKYVEYRELHDEVLSTLLTTQIDTQRNIKWAPDQEQVKVWEQSIHKIDPQMKVTILMDEEPINKNESLNTVIMPAPKVYYNVYHLRWLYIYNYLRENENIGRVWVTDGTDVEMLLNPFQSMKSGVLYTGSETKTLTGDPWMQDAHKHARLQEFMSTNGYKQLLNAGLIGGSREDVMRFAQRIIMFYEDFKSERYWGWEKSKEEEVGDMATFNLVAYEYFSDRLSYGSNVNTVFKAEERTSYSWWKHK